MILRHFRGLIVVVLQVSHLGPLLFPSAHFLCFETEILAKTRLYQHVLSQMYFVDKLNNYLDETKRYYCVVQLSWEVLTTHQTIREQNRAVMLFILLPVIDKGEESQREFLCNFCGKIFFRGNIPKHFCCILLCIGAQQSPSRQDSILAKHLSALQRFVLFAFKTKDDWLENHYILAKTPQNTTAFGVALTPSKVAVGTCGDLLLWR